MMTIDSLTIASRKDFLRQTPAFSILTEAELASLAENSQEVTSPPGAVLVREGEAGDCASLILAGSAEVTAAGADGPVTLAKLAPGELFGELALFSASGLRQATVTALTAIRLLSIPGRVYRELIAGNASAARQLEQTIRQTAIVRSLKLAVSPFAHMREDHLRELASRLTPRTTPAGTAIVRQGEAGDSCFLIQIGEVEVVLAEPGGERALATLGPGAIFGEAALLTAAPRNTTVRTLSECSLLELKRADLLAVIGEEPGLAINLRELLQLRARPRQVPGVVAVQNRSLAGEQITILKDPARSVYYRLSPQGWFIWQRLDGRHSLRDLTMAYLREFKAFAPQAIAATLAGLAAAGFIESPAMKDEVLRAAATEPLGRRLFRASRKILEFQLTLRKVDGFFTRAYRAGVFLLFTPPVQFGLALTAVAGIIAFVAGSGTAGRAVQDLGPWLLLFLIPAQYLSLVLHEAGHAFTTKAAGREVLGVGIGWYWFSLVAFVDTSDMWLATRRQRIAVSIAGPYTNLLLGSIGALCSSVVAHPVAQAALWQFALASYANAILNLNPLLEYDGYYLLADFLDRPDLRRQALGWLGHGLIPALKERRSLAGHRVDILFGLGSVVFVFVMAALTMLLYRVLLQHWIAGYVPGWIASGIAWVLVGGVVFFSGIRIIGDLKGVPE